MLLCFHTKVGSGVFVGALWQHKRAACGTECKSLGSVYDYVEAQEPARVDLGHAREWRGSMSPPGKFRFTGETMVWCVLAFDRQAQVA